MLQVILNKLQAMDIRKVFVWTLVVTTILTALMPIIAYKSSHVSEHKSVVVMIANELLWLLRFFLKDPVVGKVFGSCIFGMALNLTAIIGHSCSSYFIIYIYFVRLNSYFFFKLIILLHFFQKALTILLIILNIAISISFPLLNVLVLSQIIIAIVSFFHARNLPLGSNNIIKPQYQYRNTENV